jgi:hypothetical protein
MGWVVDKGILRLREQLDAAYPQRSHASDGTIGDAAHSARDSDHNPESPAPAGNPDNQVDAGDYTHDPAHGADMGEVSEAIRLSKDRRVKYVIYSRRIYSGPDGPQPWVWRPYTGTDPHTNHMHVSVRDSTHDQTQDWQITLEALVTDVALTPAQAQQLQAVDRRLRALQSGEITAYLIGWTDDPADRESMKAAQQLAQLVAGVENITKALASATAPVLTDEQLQALAAQLAPVVTAAVLDGLRAHPLAPVD